MDDESPPPDAFDGENLLIAHKPCTNCLFSKDRLVDEERKRNILRECYVGGTYFICHEATIRGRAVICHNFAKSNEGGGNQAIRVAQFLGAIKYVDPKHPSGRELPDDVDNSEVANAVVPLTEFLEVAAPKTRRKVRKSAKR